jgi:hypothetical protein
MFLATRPHKTSARTFCGSRVKRLKMIGVLEPGHFQGNCSYGREALNSDRHWKQDRKPLSDTPELVRRPKWRLRNNIGGQEGWPSIGKQVDAGGRGQTAAYILSPSTMC